MKKVLIVFASLLGIFILALVLIPIIFKKDIQEALDKELDNSLNAKVYYDTDAFSLSLIKNFPDLTVSIGNFGIVGKDVFASDTLLQVGTFQLTVDIMSVINGESIKIVNVLLDETTMNVLVLADGKANYDIVKASEETETTEPEDASAPLSIGIQRWELRNARIVYDDKTLPTRVVFNGMNHVGSGDLTSDIFDMTTTSSVEQFSLNYDGEEYISDKRLTADVVMEMNLATMNFTFKENRVALNDFGFGFDGWVSMPESDIDMDITFAGKDITLKSILSLIPGSYQEYLDGVTASGNVAFDGFVKGTYNDSIMPKVATNFLVSDGKVAYAGYPIPMEKIQIKANFDYPSADLRETSFTMESFKMSVDGEEVTSSLYFKDLEDYFWDFKLNGSIDLEKITKIFPIEGTELKGKIFSDLQTTGRMSDLDAGKYEKLTTTGGMEIKDFMYSGVDLPQGFGISTSKMTFDPKAINLESFKGNAGLTDLNMSGIITNYMQYALSDSAVLVGKFDFNSALVDVNEWMVPTDTLAAVPEDSIPMEIVRIPETIDFTLASGITLMKYDDLEIKDFAGKLIVKDGAIKMEKVYFNLLDGYFEMNGTYNSASALEMPLYDFGFKIQDLSIPASFKAFNTVRKLAPFAQKMEGSFSSDLTIAGAIGEGMMPVYETMEGAGLIAIKEASMQDVKLLAAVSSVTKLNANDGSLQLKDVTMKIEIKEGRVFVEPFDLVLGGQKATLSGSAGVDGTLDAAMLVTVPTGKIGDAANTLISSYTGSTALPSNIDMTLGITGTYDEPKVKLISAKPAGANAANSLKGALKDQAAQKVDAAKQEVKQVVDEKKEEAKQVVEEKKEEVKEVVDEQKDQATDKAKQEINNLLKKKKKDGGL